MTIRIALEFLCVVALTQSIEWEPLVSESVLEYREVLSTEPGLASMTEGGIWFEASIDAAVPLLRACIDTRIVLGSASRDGKSARWWEGMLRDNPAAAAGSVAELSKYYIVWDVAQWPDAYAAILPEYRVVLPEVLFEAYRALGRRLVELRAEVAAFKPVNLIPPEGLPFRADPSSVKDPQLRAEYQDRLDEIDRQRDVREELRWTENIRGEYEHILADDMRFLFKDATKDEIEQFAATAVKRQWTGTALFKAILEDWPELAHAIED